MRCITFSAFRASLLVLAFAPGAQAQLSDSQVALLPEIALDRDNIEIAQSCRIKPGRYDVADTDGNGVIHIRTDNVTVIFPEGEVELLGAPKGTPWNELTGTGIVIENATNVTITGAHCHRFKNGIVAHNADGLTLDSCDVAGGYAQHLGSTSQAEDSADWLWPHGNDEGQWLANYGAGIYVQGSSNVTISNCFARRRQNGIILDRVRDSKVYDNDCSFLSGWGLAMWRSSANVISRNAFDFCVRGYSHGVYNRGQDSAGILMFEQCHNNVFAENSVTHGGDGFFAFAGREALGEKWRETERQRLRKETGREDVDALIEFDESTLAAYRRRGHRGNLLIANDFSDAAAHGVELTFSFDNRIIGNTMRNNAICGIWGGYSQDTLIVGNTFIGNGEFGYGLERGGVNIEHGQHNIIDSNTFTGNKCGVHLWWDPDEGFGSLPWAAANGVLSADNRITRNVFTDNKLDVHLRQAGPIAIVVNEPEDLNIDCDDLSTIVNRYRQPSDENHNPKYVAYGTSRPVGARDHLAGRRNIIMSQWFAWDHESPLLRGVTQSGAEHVYELLGSAPPVITNSSADYFVTVERISENGSRIHIAAKRTGAVPYQVAITTADKNQRFEPLTGTLINATWEITYFKWPAQTHDPRTDLDAWRQLADAPEARHAVATALDLPFAFGGPEDHLQAESTGNAGIAPALTGGDHFGLIARSSMQLPKGDWQIETLSDDGVRVIARSASLGQQTPIDNWTWHGPTVNRGIIHLETDETVDFIVKHFEINGYAVLKFSLTPWNEPVQ